MPKMLTGLPNGLTWNMLTLLIISAHSIKETFPTVSTPYRLTAILLSRPTVLFSLSAGNLEVKLQSNDLRSKMLQYQGLTHFLRRLAARLFRLSLSFLCLYSSSFWRSCSSFLVIRVALLEATAFLRSSLRRLLSSCICLLLSC